MATWYVNSAVVGSTGSGNSWANAVTTLAAAINLSSAGDDFNIVYTHSESNAVSTTLGFKGITTTSASPNRVFSCGTANAPAQASDLIPGAQIGCVSNSMTLNGCVYFYGVNFICNAGNIATTLNVSALTQNDITMENCTLSVPSTATSQILFSGAANKGARVTLINTTVTFANTSSSVQTLGGNVLFWKNTPSAIQGTIPNALFTVNTSSKSGNTVLDGVDLSSLGSGKTLIAAYGSSGVFQFNNCKLGSSVTVAANPSVTGCYIDLINSDSAATGYRQERYQFSGSSFAETVNTLVGGATDGVQPISWRVSTTANNKMQAPFECFDIVQWNTFTGSAKTATLQIISNSVLTNADIWMECIYLGNASIPGASFATSAPATLLSANSALSASGAIWNGSATTPQQITVSFTPQMQGIVRFKVKVAKVSFQLWVDPKVVIS